MKNIKICTDSCSCLDDETAKHLDIFQANLSCFITATETDKQYLQNFINSQDNRNLVLLKSNEKVFMHTCGLSSIDAFPIIKRFFPTDSILYLGLSSALSGSTGNMNIDIADKAFALKRDDFSMLDTKTVAGGQLILIENAVSLKAERRSFDTILQSTKKLALKIRDYFFVSDLTYLTYGGRMKLDEFYRKGSLKQFYIGKADKTNGLTLIKRTLNKTDVLAFFIDCIKNEMDLSFIHKIYITYGDDLFFVENLKRKILDIFPQAKIGIAQASPPVLINTGNTLVGISFVAK